MTKEDNSDTVAAAKAPNEETAKVPNETENDKIAASTAGEVEIVTTTNKMVSHSDEDKNADKMNDKKEEEQTKAEEATAAVDLVVMNAGDEGSLKTEAALSEVSSAVATNVTAAGDVELTANFPQKLMEILSNEEYTEIIHWLPHGKGFIIADKKRFADEVLPKYFKKAKFTSFTRKLNRWNFVRITRGPEVGSYYQPNFQKDDLKLVSQMTCIGSKQPQAVKPLDPIALGVVPMGEAVDTAIEALGGIHQWQRQDHERYRLFYQQNHWNYMMQMMQQAKSQQDPDTTAATVGNTEATEELKGPEENDAKMVEGSDAAKADEKKVEADAADEKMDAVKAEL